MLPVKIGVSSRKSRATPDEIARVDAALDLQVNRDFAPIWNRPATVHPLLDPESVPTGVWPIFIVEKLPPGEGGVHHTEHNQPYALVEHGDTWSLAASHECLEMLADPAGNRLVASQAIAIAGGKIVPGDGKVEYLVEVCDPCESPECAYLVDDVVVSDFLTPHYFDPTPASGHAPSGVRYSFTGSVQRPRDVLKGGYLTWLDPQADEVKQLNFLGRLEIKSLGKPKGPSLRGFVDAKSRTTADLSHAHGAIVSMRRERTAALLAAATARAAFYKERLARA